MSIERLKKHKLVYLASPYSKYPAGHTVAFRHVSRAAGRLITNGVHCYSPIAHTHPIAVHGKCDKLDHKIWLPLDMKIAAVCDALLIADMEGWEDSYGVTFEVDMFLDTNRPVYLSEGLHHDCPHKELIIWAWKEFYPKYPHLVELQRKAA